MQEYELERLLLEHVRREIAFTSSAKFYRGWHGITIQPQGPAVDMLFFFTLCFFKALNLQHIQLNSHIFYTIVTAFYYRDINFQLNTVYKRI